MDNKKFPELRRDEDCTGCMACVNSCRQGALTIKKNDAGFYRPSLDVDKCIRCLLCEKSCPVIDPPQKYKKTDIKVYACWHKDDKIRLKSSSGGAFTALAETILAQGGVVVGAQYADDMTIEHTIVDSAEGLDKLRLSKYAQSKIGYSFSEVQNILSQGREVLFVGTPCQIAGLKGYLRKYYENLICVDMICHGVPSIDMLQAYLKWLEPRFGKICNINFRDKTKGWYDNLRVVKNSEGDRHVLRGTDDSYWVAFNENNNLQESCYHCQMQGFPRCSDITLADFWHIGQKIPFGHKDEIEKGVSMMIVNNPNMKWLIEAASDNMFIEERSLDEAIEGNQSAVRSSNRPISRENIYTDMNKMSFDQLRIKYMEPTKRGKLIKIFRERFPFFIVKLVRLQKQK